MLKMPNTHADGRAHTLNRSHMCFMKCMFVAWLDQFVFVFVYQVFVCVHDLPTVSRVGV